MAPLPTGLAVFAAFLHAQTRVAPVGVPVSPLAGAALSAVAPAASLGAPAPRATVVGARQAAPAGRSAFVGGVPAALDLDRLFDGAAPAAEPLAPPERRVRLTPRQAVAQSSAWLQTQAGRALSLPAFVWPFTRLAKAVAHGEPLAGLTPQAAVRKAERQGGGVVIGRLAWELRDLRSTRSAERSYRTLIREAAAARRRNGGADVGVSIDIESLGLQLRGLPADDRVELAGAAALRLAAEAKRLGVPLEIDMGTSDAMPGILLVARRIVRELRLPVRLALAARYRSSDRALLEWADLGRDAGLKLGVRLVKGSFIEADQPDAVNFRKPLLDRYRALVSLAFSRARYLDITVATHNDEIYDHVEREADRLGVPVKVDMIRGVNLALQARVRAAGRFGRVYVSFGPDAAIMGLTELYTNWRQARRLKAPPGDRVD
ncbi:MAG: proline dehydrogenase family protein [Elusimicrobia bacterium]|nr:proline dehydrogenase family protein [Elusimicrobiota bacterium]